MSTEKPTTREEILAGYVDHATENLTPNRHYSLALGALTLSRPAIRRFEQTFDRSLDLNTPAEVLLGYSETARRFFPRAIGLKLDRSDTKAQLLKTKTLGYVPTVSQSTPGAPSLMTRPNISPDQLMDMLEIDQPTHVTGSPYQLWRSHLLARSEAWGLDERLELPDFASTAHQVSKLVLRNTVRIKEGESATARSIAREVEYTTPGDTIPAARVVIEKGGDDSYAEQLRVYTATGTRPRDDIFHPEATYTMQQAAPIDDDTFPGLHEIAEHAMAMRDVIE